MACTDKAFRCVAQFIYHRVSFQKLVKHVHHATGLGNSVQSALQAVQAMAVNVWSVAAIPCGSAWHTPSQQGACLKGAYMPVISQEVTL